MATAEILILLPDVADLLSQAVDEIDAHRDRQALVRGVAAGTPASELYRAARDKNRSASVQ